MSIYLPRVFPMEDPGRVALGEATLGDEVKFFADRGADVSSGTNDLAYAPFLIVLS